MEIKRYIPDNQNVWDAFVRNSRNGIFLFLRDYMDYHSDRFFDHSLMYYNNKGKLIAVLPACEICDGAEKIFSSHAGLTFGGFILSCSVKMVDVLQLFEDTREYLKNNSFSQWVYKAVPYIYNSIPSEEEEYALWVNGAVIDVCNISTTIDLRSHRIVAPDYERQRRRRKAEMMGYKIDETDDIDRLWPIVDKLLREKYGVAPVHSCEEMSLLKKRFPNNIRCFVASLNGEVQGGVVIYESETVAHAQYSEASEQGRADGVTDMLYLFLIEYYKNERNNVRYFDFGISNEQRGRYLNRALIFYKEDFGGRGVVYRQYRMNL